VKRARDIVFYEKSDPELYRSPDNDYDEFIKNFDTTSDNFGLVKSSSENSNKNNSERDSKKSDTSINRLLNDSISKLSYASKISIVEYNYINYLIKTLSGIY
jgi:hypothetical protein